ncbi:MAG: PIN domain-containing protein [Candidatus Sulfotelmatobacter sp.]
MKPASAGPVLVDTGPLLAIVSRQDTHHRACVQALRDMAAPLRSCRPVLPESAWLSRLSPRAVQQLFASIDRGLLELLPRAGAEATAVAAGMKKYESIRPQLADAALVSLAARGGSKPSLL